MPGATNFTSDLTLDSEGVDLGRNLFQSFLLAGERYLQANLQRPNTDEARFRDLYLALPVEVKEPVASYFKRQAGLDLSQRAQILGSLTNIRIEAPLTIYQTAPLLTTTPHFREVVQQVVANRALHPHPVVLRAAAAPPREDFNTLGLRLNKLTVEKGQDAFHVPILGWQNTTDEVTVGYVSIDETGEVKHGAQTIGDIKQGNTKNYPGDGLELTWFNLHEGATFPKFYSVLVSAIERDNGGYNKFLEEGAKYVKDKVTKELLVRGIVAGGAYFGVTIPPAVANYIANIVKTFFDKLIDWLGGLLHNDDDVLGTATATATINGLVGVWGNSGTLASSPFDWVFNGQGGRWRTTMHWQLTKK